MLRIAAGLVQADAGERFAHPGTTIQYLSQEPDLAGFTTTLAYVEAGFDAAAAEGRHRALYLLKELGLEGNEDPASLSGGEAQRAALAPWLRHPTSCCSTSRPITLTCPASSGGSANWPSCAPASS